MADGEIKLVATLEGEGSLGSQSAKNIKDALDRIMLDINKNPLKVKIVADDDGLKKLKDEIRQISGIAKREAAEIRDALSGATKDAGKGRTRSGGDSGDIKRSAEEIIKYQKALSKTESMLQQVRVARESWTAAEKGLGKSHYKDLGDQNTELELLIDQLLKYEIELEDFEAKFSQIQARFSTSKERINLFGEDTSTIKKDSEVYHKVLSEIDKFSSKYKNDYIAKWTAASNGLSSNDYANIIAQAEALDILRERVEAGTMSLTEYRAALSQITFIAEQSANAIRDVGENMAADNSDAISKKISQSVTELGKMRENLLKWSTSETGRSAADYNVYLDQAVALEKYINQLRNGEITIDNFNAKLAEIKRVASDAADSIKYFGEDHGVEEKMLPGSRAYIDSLEKIQKARFELQENLKKWSAAGAEGAVSFDDFNSLKGVVTLFDELEAKVREGSMTLGEFRDILLHITNTASEYGRAIKGVGEDHGVEKKMTKDSEDTKDYLASLKKVNDELKSVEANKKKWSAAENASATTEDYKKMVAQIENLSKLKTKLEEGRLTLSEFNAEFNKIKLNLSESTLNIESSKHAMTKAEEAEKFTKQLKEVDAALEQNEKNIREWSLAKFGKGKDSFAGLEDVIAKLKKLRKQLLETGQSVDAFDDIMAGINNSSAKYGGNIKTFGEDSKTLGDNVVSAFNQLGRYIDIMDVVFRGIQWGRQMVESVTNIDTAMTELRKVTEETDATYAAFLDDAATRAHDLGATVVDVVSASADFARLGHGLDDASDLADAALVYKNVGDGIKDVETASSSIISTMQAFGIEAENAMSIVDSFNAIGNNFAISSKGVGDALLNSAASLHAAGNDIHESIALIAAANTTIQDPGRVGKCLPNSTVMC